MQNEKKTTITKDGNSNQLLVTRAFDAPLEKVWQAWTEKELLDQWWAPRPWKATTKTIAVRKGGHWLYAMVGPDGSQSWSKADFIEVQSPSFFKARVYFCDEQGVLNEAMPSMEWNCSFSASGNGTLVKVEIVFDSLAMLEKVVAMGFKEGFTSAHGNLDELLEQH